MFNAAGLLAFTETDVPYKQGSRMMRRDARRKGNIGDDAKVGKGSRVL